MQKVFIAVCGLLLLSGCSGDKKPEPKLAEIPTTSEKLALDTPEAELYREGKRLYELGLFSVARDQFEAIKNGYPTGAFTEFAEIKSADCLFQTQDYSGAAGMYEEFAKNRPLSSSTPYILVMAARSHQLASNGVGRDSAPVEKAVEIYDRILHDYPDSPYRASILTWKQEAQQEMAATEKTILEFYEGRDKEKALAERKRVFEVRWAPLLIEPNKPPVQLASLTSLTSANAAESSPIDYNQQNISGGGTTGGPIVFQAARYNGQDVHQVEKHAQAMFASLRETALTPDAPAPISAKAAAAINIGPVAANISPQVASSQVSGPLVQQIECKNLGTKTLFVHFTAGVDTQTFLKAHSGSETIDKIYALSLPARSFSALEASCFSNKDVTLAQDGTLKIHSDKPLKATFFSLNFPPRLAIQLESASPQA